MPTITPPPNYIVPPEPEREIPISIQERINRNRKTEIFLNVPGWICPVCGANNFGRNKQCVYCKMRNHVDTPRPKGEGVEKLQR